ncbi:multiple sugar transport system permease protein [Bacillus sp. SLBN-46]|uniref:carbohydrate ABC transporter permease n=1 Tax=Bacillus sp. SLBN-46 TaxID=3042283 RepID=UPI002857DF17|nr:carbohydrate ABC transporter permease [Bacillus sp. SLBN-46]MDR6125286.1 multiple sugar transport system permease protein [Bacillus sp. SLBN-46]
MSKRLILKYGNKFIFGLSVTVFLAIVLFPFIWQLINSLKPPGQLYKMPPDWWPEKFFFENYINTFVHYPFANYIINSFLVAGVTTLFCLVVASFTAYAVARLNIKGKNFIMLIVLTVSMFPPIAIISPLYLMMKNVGLLNTYLSLIIPYTTFALPLAIWNLSTFFKTIPLELEESAKMDGASTLQTYFKIILPLALPGVFTTAIIVFVTAWNEFLFALTFNTKELMRTVPVGISMFQGQYDLPWGEIASATIIVTIPLIILVLFFQKKVVSGLTSGAVKG